MAQGHPESFQGKVGFSIWVSKILAHDSDLYTMLTGIAFIYSAESYLLQYFNKEATSRTVSWWACDTFKSQQNSQNRLDKAVWRTIFTSRSATFAHSSQVTSFRQYICGYFKVGEWLIGNPGNSERIRTATMWQVLLIFPTQLLAVVKCTGLILSLVASTATLGRMSWM